MTAKELISQYVDTGLQLPEYQVNKLSNQDKKTYIRKRLIALQSGGYLDGYEMELLNPDEKDNYISNLNSYGIHKLLYHSSDNDKAINVLLNNDTLISKLDSDGIGYLLDYSSDKDKVINILLNNDTLISNLDKYGIRNLLDYSTDKDKVSNVLLNNYTFIIKLDSDRIYYLLLHSSDKDKVINILLNNDTLISNLDKYGMSRLLYYSSEPEMVMKRFGDKGRELISEFRPWHIKDLLKFSKNKDAIKRIFDKYGIDYTMYESIKSLLRKNMIYL
jgi:hypothetical protein